MALFGKKAVAAGTLRRDFDANFTVELLLWAAEAFRKSPLRNGQMLSLPVRGDLVVAADLHHHTRNFDKMLRHAALDQFPQRHLILQELIHGGALGPNGEDSSFDMLLSALVYAQKFPHRVHMLLANHDLAQVQHTPVMKDGYDLVDRFTRHFEQHYTNHADKVLAAYKDFVFSMPLAAITATGLFFSHSLPGDRDLPTFDTTIMRRPLAPADYERTGSVFKLIWGRNQSPATVAALAKAWWSDFFICGHQQQDEGYRVFPPNFIVIDSSHNLGTYLQIDLARQYLLEDLTACIHPIASIE